jgi:hypothetical protein
MVAVRSCLAAVAILVSPCVAAQADTLTFSYYDQPINDTFAGVLEGTLLADRNHFAVTAIDSLTANGVPVTLPFTFVGSWDTGYLTLYGGSPNVGGYLGNGLAVVTLDGSYIDFAGLAYGGQQGFFFFVNDAYDLSQSYTRHGVVLGPGVGGYDAAFPFIDSNWTASVTAVPEPTSFALFGFGMASLGAFFLRSRSQRMA